MFQIKVAQAGGVTSAGNNNSSQEIASLKSENAKLKAEVESWKSKLSAAEVANGKKLFRKFSMSKITIFKSKFFVHLTWLQKKISNKLT